MTVRGFWQALRAATRNAPADDYAARRMAAVRHAHYMTHPHNYRKG